MKYISNSVTQTEEFGRRIGELLSPGDVVGLFGGLATGKTIMAKGVLKGIGMKNVNFVKSPSFILMREYEVRNLKVYHFDLYRIDSIEEIQEMGWDELISSNCICIIEWAQKAKEIMPQKYLKVKLSIEGRSCRMLTLIPKSKEYIGIVERLNENDFSNQIPQGDGGAKPEHRNQKK